MKAKVHYRVENHGTLFLLRPVTKQAVQHLNDIVDPEAQWFGGALIVEHRYIHELCDALVANGWKVA